MRIQEIRQKHIILNSILCAFTIILAVVVYKVSHGEFSEWKYEDTYRDKEKYDQCVHSYLNGEEDMILLNAIIPGFADRTCRQWKNRTRIVSINSVIRGLINHFERHPDYYFAFVFVIYFLPNAIFMYSNTASEGWKRLSLLASLLFAITVIGTLSMNQPDSSGSVPPLSILIGFCIFLILGLNLILGVRNLYLWIREGFNRDRSDPPSLTKNNNQSDDIVRDKIVKHNPFSQRYFWLLLPLGILAFVGNYFVQGDEAIVTLISTVVAGIGIILFFGIVKLIRRVFAK